MAITPPLFLFLPFPPLRFQLTVNLCALSVAAIAAVASGFYPGRSGTPLNVLELLWVK